MNNKLFKSLLLFGSSVAVLASCGGGGSTTTSTTTIPPEPLEDNKVHLVVLAGQSGARGKGLTEDLTADQKTPSDDVYIYEDGYQMNILSGNIPQEIVGAELVKCKPGFGDSASEVGPEIGIAQTLQTRYTGFSSEYKTVIVKFTACGSDFTNHWYSTSMIEDKDITTKLNKDANHLREYKGKQTGPLTHNLYLIIQNCIDELKEEGLEATIDGLAWVHGEMDAQDPVQAPIYEQNLKYFINDFRDEFGEDIPVAVSGIFTDCPRYKETVAKAQENVCNSVQNVRYVSTEGLHTNPFEPWHFSAQSNVELGNRIAATLISDRDSREFTTLNLPEYLDGKISVPYGYKIELPEYLPFNYKSDYAGFSQVRYITDYDENTLGEQEVEFAVNNINGIHQVGKLPVEVTSSPFIDGKVTEKELYTQINQTSDDKVKLYYASDENGLYIAGEIEDDNIWSDAELWSQQDMGQMNRNDDIRMFVIGKNETSAENHYSICLSVADMFRSYEKGTDMYGNLATLPNKNRYFKNRLSYTNFRALWEGEANTLEKKSEGWTFEFYVAFEDINANTLDDIKVCFLHSDISNLENISGKAGLDRNDANSDKYIVSGASAIEHKENDLGSYFTLE